MTREKFIDGRERSFSNRIVNSIGEGAWVFLLLLHRVTANIYRAFPLPLTFLPNLKVKPFHSSRKAPMKMTRTNKASIFPSPLCTFNCLRSSSLSTATASTSLSFFVSSRFFPLSLSDCFPDNYPAPPTVLCTCGQLRFSSKLEIMPDKPINAP